jgi:hypothetical protein
MEAYILSAAIKEAGIYICIGLVIAGLLVAISLFRLSKALRDQRQRLP